jgi:hypothetical protein
MTKLPTISINEADAIAVVSTWIEPIREKMTAAASREWLEAGLYGLLMQGLAGKLRVVEAADAGDDLAHKVLMRVDAELSELGQESATLKAYRIRVQVEGRPKRGPGRPVWWQDNWRRDIGITCLVYFTCLRFGVLPTCNRERRRAHQITGSSIVSAALGLHLPNISPPTVQNICLKYWDHLKVFLQTAQIAVPD